MIKFDGVRAGGLGPLDFEVKAAEACRVIACSDEDKNAFLDVLLGFKRPESGRVFVSGNDIYSISEAEYIKLFRRVGVVLETGGLISNLKVWENIVLPLRYHDRVSEDGAKDIERKAAGIFKEMGIEGAYLKALMGRLPGPLPSSEKKLVGLVRAMLMEPEIMIYDSLMDGIGPELRNGILKLAENFHQGRTSVYISSNAFSLEGVTAGLTIDLSSIPERGEAGT